MNQFTLEVSQICDMVFHWLWQISLATIPFRPISIWPFLGWVNHNCLSIMGRVPHTLS